MFGACETPAVTLSSIQQRRPLLYQSHLTVAEPPPLLLQQCLSLSLSLSLSGWHGISERRDVSEMKKSPSECDRNWPLEPETGLLRLLTLPSTARTLERFLYINTRFFKEKLVLGRRCES
jgi:hypothetical protein